MEGYSMADFRKVVFSALEGADPSQFGRIEPAEGEPIYPSDFSIR